MTDNAATAPVVLHLDAEQYQFLLGVLDAYEKVLATQNEPGSPGAGLLGTLVSLEVFLRNGEMLGRGGKGYDNPLMETQRVLQAKVERWNDEDARPIIFKPH